MATNFIRPTFTLHAKRARKIPKNTQFFCVKNWIESTFQHYQNKYSFVVSVESPSTFFCCCSACESLSIIIFFTLWHVAYRKSLGLKICSHNNKYAWGRKTFMQWWKKWLFTCQSENNHFIASLMLGCSFLECFQYLYSILIINVPLIDLIW